MANQHVRQTLKMNYSDFWEGDLINDEPFFKTLAKKYDLEIVDSPDIFFFSCFGHDHLKYKCLKVFLTGENIKPDLRFCDYSYLIQGRAKEVPKVASLIKGTPSYKLMLSFDEKWSDCLFMPNSTWVEGRNILLQMAKNKNQDYLYYSWCSHLIWGRR